MIQRPVPRRSVLYLPASNPRALLKAASLPCDALILDLEDAVGPEAKPAARQAACEAISAGGFAPREVAVRVNAPGTQWFEADLAAVSTTGVDAVVIPKVESAQQIEDVVTRLNTHGAPPRQAVWAMLETPVGILRAAEIAEASDRLTVLVVGTNDLTKELGAQDVPGRAPLLVPLGLAILAARATGRAVLDGVYNTVDDAAGLADQCRQGRDLGFDGKTLIHPRQIQVANEIFGPSPQEIAQAQALLEAFENAGSPGVFTHAGVMVERLHIDQARRVLQVQESILARRSG